MSGKNDINTLLKGSGKDWRTTAQESVERVVVEVDTNTIGGVLKDESTPPQNLKPVEQGVGENSDNLVSKPKKKSTKTRFGSNIVEISDSNQAEFKGLFLSTQRGHPDFKQVNTHMPKNIELLVKQKMLEDGLSMVELTNLLFINYVENGLPTNLIKRYKKVSSD